MAKQGKEVTKPTKAADKSVEEIEADLQFPESSEDEEEEQLNGSGSGSEQELSSEDDDEEEDEELEGLSDDAAIAEDDATTTNNTSSTDKHSVNITSTSNKSNKSNKNSHNNNNNNNKSGVIYIGRIPSGFEEPEMKKYFNQFGEIERVRISRNKKTGKSKHYGYIKFRQEEVAKIAAETMNNYLIFGHLLKVEFVENANSNLFIGDIDQKFRVIPRQQISLRKYNAAKSQEDWDKIETGYKVSKVTKQENLKKKGINYSI